MIPTFPSSPLRFRTAGFPQYGSKTGISDGAFPHNSRLKSAPDIPFEPRGLPPSFVRLVTVESRDGAVPAKAGPFPPPAHRTGHADLLHPALGLDLPRAFNRLAKRRIEGIVVSHTSLPAILAMRYSFLGRIRIVIGVSRFPNLPILPFFESAPEPGPLPSVGFHRLPRCRVGGGAPRWC